MKTQALKKIILAVLFIAFATHLSSQRKRVQNLKDFDGKPYHFGFLLGFNTANLYMDAVFNPTDSVVSVDPVASAAFTIGPIASLKITENFRIRATLPSLSFQDRSVDYVFNVDGSLEEYSRVVRSVYLEFPVNLKLRTDRINNVAFYAVGGAKYGFNFSSKQKVKVNYDFNDILKISKTHYAYEVGGGIDFFLPYFKLGLELKLSVGINNVLVQENTFFSSPIERLRTQMWLFAVTFEG